MTNVNLSWPRWAELAAHLSIRTIQKRGGAPWRIVHKAAALLANRYGRQQDARFALLAWEQKRERERCSEENRLRLMEGGL